MKFTKEHLYAIAMQPHLLGTIVGKDRLTPLHSEWIKHIWQATESTSLQAHRGSYKTTAVAIIGSMVWLLFHPSDRIAIIRKTFTDAAEVTTTISIMMKLPAVRELFKAAHGFYPQAVIDREGKLLFNFKKTVTPEPSITAHGLDYGLTGKHYDRILCDDFVTLKDRTSKAERDKSKEVLREILTNIIDPGQPVSFIGTPWARLDAWEQCPEPVKFDVWMTGILSPEEIEQKQKTTTPVLFAANYLLEHQSDDMALFKDPQYGLWDYTKRGAVAHIDSAYDGDHYCAMTIIGQLPDGKRQAVGFTSPGNVKDWLDFIQVQYQKYRCLKIFGETNADKGYTNDELKKRGLVVSGYAEHENKHIKISTHGFQHWPDTIWSQETDPEYMEQMLDYREGQEPDDACLVSSTKVLTLFGDKAIESIKVGEFVWTPFGFRRVLAAGCTGEKEVLNNGILQGTSTHKVYNQLENKFKALDSFAFLKEYAIISLRGIILWKILNVCYLMEFGMQEQTRENIISLKGYQTKNGRVLSNCIRLCMNFIQVRQFRKAFMFTIRILTQIIMSFLIWNYFQVLNIFRYMQNEILKTLNLKQQFKNRCGLIKNWLRNGIKVLKEKNGIKNTLQNLWVKLGGSRGNGFVSNVVKNIWRIFIPNCFALNDVELIREMCFMEKTGFAKNVGKQCLLKINEGLHEKPIVPLNALKLSGEKKQQKVYNLTIEQAGCFYANEVLVSNCDSFASLNREAFNQSNMKSRFHNEALFRY